MDKERFEKQKNFILEIDKEKNILRQTHLSGGGRRENDAEHAWHMAIMVYLLQEYANEPIDLAKTMMMVLTHIQLLGHSNRTFMHLQVFLQLGVMKYLTK